MRNEKAEEIIREINLLRNRQGYFTSEVGHSSNDGFIVEFRYQNDFEREILNEASQKIADIYEENIRKKIQELAKAYD